MTDAERASKTLPPAGLYGMLQMRIIRLQTGYADRVRSPTHVFPSPL